MSNEDPKKKADDISDAAGNPATQEQQEFIRKIRDQIALEDEESATLIAAFNKGTP